MLDCLNLALALWLLMSLWPQPLPMLPLLGSDSPPGALRAPSAVQGHTVMRLNAVGGVITTEDLVRWLVSHPEALNPERREILALLKQKRDQLLSNEEALLEVEQQLNLLALAMWNALTPEQQSRLKNKRNLDSVLAMEAPYWQSLLDGAVQ